MIRRFKDGNEKALSHLVMRCLDETLSKEYAPEVIEYFKHWYTPEEIKNYGEKFDFYVVEEDERMVGCGALHNKEIKTFFILPNYQGKGIGTGLLEFLEDIAKEKGIKKLHLDSYLNSTPFYKAKGYVVIKREDRNQEGVSYSIDYMEKEL